MPSVKYYEKLSESEYQRLDELFLRIRKGENLDASDVFNSKEVPKMLEGVTANLGDGADWKNLHYLAPFYKTILVDICPHCPNHFDDIDYKLIEYYLDNNIILPIIGPYDLYPSKLIDLILQYPYTTIGSINLNIINNKLSLESCVCPNCLHGEGYEIIEDYIKNKRTNSKQSSDLNNSELETIENIWYDIRTIEYNKYYTNKLVSSINIKSSYERQLSLDKLLSEVTYTYGYISSKSLKSNYVLNFENINQAKSSLDNTNEVFIQYPEFNKLILQGLHLYSPKDISNLDYINLIIENRKKIQNIVKLIPDNYLIDQNYIKIKAMFDDINEEVRELSSSKRMGLLKFSTNFVSLNINLLKSGILKLCGYKDVNIEIPDIEDNLKDKTVQYFSEKILPIYLQKPLPLIQLWKLQKDIKRL